MSRVALVKLQPNQELYSGLELASQRAGFYRALILSGVGSLNDAWFETESHDEKRQFHCVPGPGLEIAGITGEICINDGGEKATRLTGWVAQVDGRVSGGVLARDRNIVCITFEFTLMEWDSLETSELGNAAGIRA